VRLRTLSGRLALVQSGLTLLALAAVILGTWLALASLLERRRDAILRDAVERGVEAVRLLGVYAQDGDWMERELNEIRPADVRIELQAPDGFVLAASGPAPEPGPARPGCRNAAELRACAAPAGIFTIQASSARQADAEEGERFLLVLIATSMLAGALLLLASRAVARRTLRPLSELALAVSSIEPESNVRLQRPLAFAELDQVRVRFDELLERFHHALARERRLTAQASHELRTPLGVARAEVEAISAAGDLTEGKARALGALDRLTQLVEVLLWFARVQEPLDVERMALVNLADLLRQELGARAAALSSVELACQLPDELLVRGDETLLQRLAGNLIDNAVKHGDGRRMEVAARVLGSQLHLSVSNTGTPLEAELRERVFEPFWRAQAAAMISGFGLGLPFARAIARAHAGDVELADAGPDEICFVLKLPLVHWSGAGAAVHSQRLLPAREARGSR
jgi:signal transduction histidine kinase